MFHKQISGKFAVYSLVALGVLFLGLGLLNLVDRLRWNDPYDGITWEEREEGVVVAAVDPSVTPPAVRAGDLLIRVGTREVLSQEDYIKARFSMVPGQTVEYEFQGPEDHSRKVVQVQVSGQSVLTIKDAFRILLAFVYLFIGSVVLIRFWRTPGGVHFYILCLFSFSLYLFSYTKNLTALDWVVYWMSILSILALPPLFLHLCLNFPVRKSWLARSLFFRAVLYLPGAVLVVLEVLWFTGALKHLLMPRTPSIRELLDNIHITIFIIYFFFGVAVLFHNRFSLQAPELRQQMKWIITGTLLAILPFFFLYVLPYLLNLEITSIMQASMLSLALLPLAFAYAIMKYRLTDVDIIFKQGAAYFLASAVILGVYFLLVGLSGLIFKYFFPASHTLAIAFSALAAAFMFAPLRSRIQREIDRFFYKEEYKYRQSLVEIGRTLSTESSIQTVTSTIMDRVAKSLKVDAVAIFLKIQDEDGYELAAFTGLPASFEPAVSYKIPKEFVITEEESHPLPYRIFREDAGNWLRSLRAFYESLSVYYFQPLVHRGEVMGMIGLGRGQDGGFLSSEDFGLLRMLSGYAAIALENARLYTTLQNKAGELGVLKAYNESIIEGIRAGVAAVSLSGTVTTWNRSMESICGASRAQAVGRPFQDLFSPDVYASILKALGSETLVAAETSNIYKLFMENARGEARFVNLSMSPFQDSGGQVTGTILVFDDITAKVQLEKQLFQAEKLSSLGLIAAGVAHEVNTPLTGISSFTQMLIQDLPAGDPNLAVLKKIEKQCFRASEIVNNLLNFSRMQTDELKPVDLNRVLEETMNLLDHQFRKQRTQVVRDMEPGLPAVRGNEGRLMQVFVNILINARDAVSIPGGRGRIGLRTRSTHQSVLVQIEDNGKGIPPEIIHKIYDPFFTTKDTGKGTGLGLSVSYGIVQEHSGRIFVDSRPGEGTCFTITLPRERGETRGATPTPQRASQGGGAPDQPIVP